jgi:hypothetical protein
MNLGSLGSLFIDLAANTAKFETDIGRASRLAEKQAKQIQKSVSDGVEGAVLKLGALAAAYVTLDATIGKLKNAIDQGAKLDDMAQKIGANVTTLSHINYAAAHEGVDDITGSLVKLNKAILDSKNPSSEQAQAFKALGISTTDAAGKLRGTDDVFLDVVKRFGETEDGIAKTNIALALFGKSGAELIPLLNKGASGFERLAKQSDAFGATWSPESAAMADQLKDNLWEMGKALDGLFIKLAQQVTPHIVEFTNKIADPKFQASISHWTDEIIRLTEVLVANLPRILQLFAAIKGAQAGAAIGGIFGPIGAVVGGLAGAGVAGSAAEALTDRFADLGDEFKTAAEKAKDVQTQLITLGAEYSRLQQRIQDGASFREGGTAGLTMEAQQADSIAKRMQELAAQSGAPQGPKLSPRGGSALQFDPAATTAAAAAQKLLNQATADGIAHFKAQLDAEAKLRDSQDALISQYETAAQAIGDDTEVGKYWAAVMSGAYDDVNESGLQRLNQLAHEIDAIKAATEAAKRYADVHQDYIQMQEQAASKALSTSKTYGGVDDSVSALQGFEKDRYGKQNKQLEADRDAPGADADAANKAIEEAYKTHQDRMAEIAADGEKAKADITNRYLDAGKSALSDAADAAALFGKKGFEAYKAAAIAETVISTYQSAQNAYSSLSSIPYIGPVLGVAAAAAAIGAGLARVSAIRSQTYAARRYGGAVNAGGMYEVAEPGNPELLRYGNKTLLMMGDQSGVVEPATRGSPAAAMSGPNAARTPTIINRAPGVDISWMDGLMYVDMQEPLLRVAVGRSQAAIARDQEFGGPLTKQRRSIEGGGNIVRRR